MAELAKLKSRVKMLEEQVFEKNEELQRYQSMGNAADDKIQALGKIHNDKIRSLMNSIQSLKKENATLQNQGKEHKRSKLIAQLNKQIDDQDTVIEVLRNEIYKRDGKQVGRAVCDNMIVAALTKGPQRIRALSREQLKMQIERLKNQVLLFKTGKFKKEDQPSTTGNIRGKQPNMQLSEVSQASLFENTNEQVLKQLQQLTTTNQTLKLQLKSSHKVIQNLTNQLKANGKLQVQITTCKSDLQVAHRKIEVLESLLRQNKQQSNAKIMQLYEREVKVEQLELQSKQATGKLNLMQQNHNILIEQLRLQKQKLETDLQSLTKQNQRLIFENSSVKKRQQQQKIRLNQIRDTNNKQKQQLTAKLSNYQKEIARILKQSESKSQKILQLQNELRDQTTKLTAQKLKMFEELEHLRKNGVTLQQLKKLREKQKLLSEQIQQFKKIIDAGSVAGDSSTGNQILLMRIKTYQVKLSALEKKLREQGKMTEKQIEALGDTEWYNKYVALSKQYEEYKLKNKQIILPTKGKKPVEIIDLDKSQRNRLDNLSSGVSQIGLKSVDQRILNNYDSDYEFQIRSVEPAKMGLPKISKNDQQLLQLINSDIWQFIKQDKLGILIDDVVDQYDSQYQQPEQLSNYDQQWDKNIKELKQLRSKMRTNTKPISAASFAQQVDLGRLSKISSNISSSIDQLNVSVPQSGQSEIHIPSKRKPVKQKATILAKNRKELNSDYEGLKQAKLRVQELDSDVSITSSMKSHLAGNISSDVQTRFRKK